MDKPLKEPLQIMVCRHYLRETEAILQSTEFVNVGVRPFMPACNHPQHIPTVMKQIEDTMCQENCISILVGGCFVASTDLLPRVVPPRRVFHKEKCFYLLTQPDLVDGLIQQGSYILTPGWLAEWRNKMEQWGFDQPTARDFFHETTQRLTLLDTGVDPTSPDLLKEMAEYLDLPFQVFPLGLDYYRMILSQIVLEWRMEQERQQAMRVNQKIADYAMSLDLLTQLVSALTEAEIIDKIIELFSMLFAPGELVYLRVVNDQAERILPRSTQPADPGVYQDRLAERQADHAWLEAQQGFYLKLIHQEKLVGYIELSKIAFPSHHHEYLNLALSIARICALAISNARLFDEVQFLAGTDSLTGMNNRRQFMTLAGHNFTQARRYDRPLSMMMMDIDHFKKVNDTYGHLVGDQVLVEIARRCNHEMRDSDIFGRYGGEEFIVALPETDLPHAMQAAERIRQGIANSSIAVGELKVNVTISIGVAALDQGCTDIGTLIERCDQAMYRAKRKGRNQVSSRIGPDTSVLDSH